MGRQNRLLIPDLPHHIVQRGHDRNAVFVEDADYRFYLDNLIFWKDKYHVDVYAYCLMTNHVHLIVAPKGSDGDVSSLMRRISARQCRRVNKLEGRSGTLWSGRFKSSVIDTDSYLLACLRYVELNPVRAGIVVRPELYRWSSYCQRVGLATPLWLDNDPAIDQLGNSDTQRRRAYSEFVARGSSPEELDFLRKAVRRNQLTGDATFIDEIERRTARRVASRGRGRPETRSEK